MSPTIKVDGQRIVALPTRAATSVIGSTIAELTREAGSVTAEIKTGVERSRAAQRGFGTIDETVREVNDIVAMLGRRTEGIRHAASLAKYSKLSVEQRRMLEDWNVGWRGDPT